MSSRFDVRRVLSFWTGFESVLDVEGPTTPTAVPRRVNYAEAIRTDARAVACDTSRLWKARAGANDGDN